MAEPSQDAVEALRKQSGLSEDVCAAALRQHGGDETAALHALIESGQVDPTNLDPDLVPEELFARASMQHAMSATRDYAKEMRSERKGCGPIGLMLRGVEWMLMWSIGRAIRRVAAKMTPEQLKQLGEMARRSAQIYRQEKRLKGTVCDDRVFGQLKWDVMWQGEVALPAFDATVEVLVDRGLDGTPPDDAQRAAYQSLLAMGDQLREKLEQAHFEYYQTYREEFVAFLEETDVPELTQSDEIWQLLEGPDLFIPVQQGSDWEVELSWSCTWEVEHGHKVTLRNGVVVDIGGH